MLLKQDSALLWTDLKDIYNIKKRQMRIINKKVKGHADTKERMRYLLKWIIPVGLLIFAFTVYYWTTGGEHTPYNNFVRLADAFLNKRLYLLEDVSWLELTPIEEKHYVVPPPLPAILILPAVALFGTDFNQTLASVLFGSINVVLAYFISFKLTNRRTTAILLSMLFGFGTIHWWATVYGGVWTFSQITAILFLFLAVYETLTLKRPLIIGLLLGAAYWSRLPTILSLPFFLVMLRNKWYKRNEKTSILKRIRLQPIALLFAGLIFFVLLNFAYNYARFHTIFDVSYSLRKNISTEPWFQQGLVNLAYIPRHLEVVFKTLPEVIDTFPYLKPRMFGLAIWFTTPAFVYSLMGLRKRQLFIAGWLAVLCIALLNFCHGSTGAYQFGYRFALDFYPFLFLLTANGIGKSPKWHAKLLILLSVIINIWGMISIYYMQIVQ